MSKVYTDNIEKRTGGTAIALPASGKWSATTQLDTTGTASATTFLRGDGSWQSADPATDSIINAQIKSDAAIAQTKLANVSKWTSAATAPTSPAPANGDQWYDTSLGKLKVYVSTATPADWQDVAENTGNFSATGGTETTVGAWTVHTFTSSGNFVASGTADIDVMIVAGGGSGGGRHGGGGGGGGVVVKTVHSTVTGTYAIVVGAGGARVGSDIGNDGADSTGFSMTAKGGGGGGTYNANGSVGNARVGGSGGGAVGYTPNQAGGTSNQQSSGTPTGGTVTAYGNAGGIGYHGPSDSRMDGGGGGAGAVGGTGGVNTAPYKGGDGGVGIQNNYDGNNYYWGAGGGGGMWSGPAPATDHPGGTGGIGGGGGGGTAANPGGGPAGAGGGNAINSGDAGVSGGTSSGGDAGVNTGSGGGGGGQGGGSSGYTGGGGAGGSGIVIIRYGG